VPAPAFAVLSRQSPSLLGPTASRRCCPGRGSRIDRDDRPPAPPGTAARSTPWSGRRYILVEYSSCCQLCDHECVEGAKSRCDHNEEVTCHNHVGVVMNEGQPTLLSIGCAHRAVAQVLPHGTGAPTLPSIEQALTPLTTILWMALMGKVVSFVKVALVSRKSDRSGLV
jgi:hypothetical protein